MRILISFLTTITMAYSQFGKVDITIDDRLLRDNERQELSSLKDEVIRFFSGRIWHEDFQGLKIPLHISIAFQNTTSYFHRISGYGPKRRPQNISYPDSHF